MVDYKKDAQIDVNALDVEWVQHPELCRKYIEQASSARLEARWAEEEVKTVRSELILEANTNPEECCNKAKPNANDIEAYYRDHIKYKAAKQEAIEAVDAAQVAEDMKSLMHFTRTKALEQLVTLQTQSYFVGPDTPRNINREIEKKNEMKKEVTRSIGSKMRRKK